MEDTVGGGYCGWRVLWVEDTVGDFSASQLLLCLQQRASHHPSLFLMTLSVFASVSDSLCAHPVCICLTLYSLGFPETPFVEQAGPEVMLLSLPLPLECTLSMRTAMPSTLSIAILRI